MFLAAGAFALSLSGCPGSGDSPLDDSSGSGTPAATPTGHEGHDHPSGTAASEHAEALAKLSEADQALAAKQKTCPVTGATLGSMGTPVKITVKGRDVLLCCQGCEPEIKKGPDKYLAKLPE
jgi:hypothetical protein